MALTWDLLDGLITVWLVGGTLGFVVLYLDGARRFLRIQRLDHLDPPEPDTWPRLSVVVPARDEEDTLEPALRSLAAADYPELEVLCINDRSSDGTAGIIERVGADSPRVRPLHIAELPSGWLGKVHALDRGVKATEGEWLLFTDADVVFSDGLLRRAIALAEHRGIDHLSVLPRMHTDSLWAEACMSGFGLLFITLTRADAVGDPASSAYSGLGAFNLVRRSALESSEGLQALRMEVGDDVGLGWLLRQAGARSEFCWTGSGLDIKWYPDLPSMFRGLEKNAFPAACRFSYTRCAVLVISCWMGLVAPWAAIFVAPFPHAWLLGVAFVLAWGIHWGLNRYLGLGLGLSPLGSFLSPLGLFLVSLAIVRSAWRCWRQGGIRWRETHYSVDELRAGQRIKL